MSGNEKPKESDWVEVKGYEGLYAINRNGEIKSLAKTIYQPNHGYRKFKEYTLKPWDNGHGYKVVSLAKEGKRKNHYMHRLVAEHFIENPNNYPEVNHIDYDKGNNNVNNLEWVSRKMNMQHSIIHMHNPKNTSTYSDKTNTGYSYICQRAESERYRIIINGVEKQAGTLEEAITIRDAMLKEVGRCLTAY